MNLGSTSRSIDWTATENLLVQANHYKSKHISLSKLRDCRGCSSSSKQSRINLSTAVARTHKMVTHHLLTGSYTNSSLYLLAFDTIARTLTLNATVPGFGLHQFVTSNAARDRIYATTMSEPPRIFSWAMTPDYKFTHLNTVNVSKYMHGRRFHQSFTVESKSD